MARNLIAVVLFALAACNSSVCSRKSDCASGLTCTPAGVCAVAPDASTSDVTDAGADDASSTVDSSIDGGP